ncbi:amidohydrolase family protein [Butyricicoccus porcorum]|uniref:Guanine deaminase n=1 Tax=Butyricicoccus porcorum TaxID=1945634 RepID=A0A252F243_9FIRM|nr:amidohydrolase family protein [Butyricicoccus porcorum]MDD6986828.1 amidohydrolase family protein [Butyricicoccus porcorum]MDY4483192.1 amidohydrolase family protein [Butyricicoccus porcorum]OUM19771.1 guanine deaminase [Butyricicoccus porcorum]
MSLQQDSFALKGNICYSINPREVYCGENCYVVCAEGRSAGVFRELPEQFSKLHVYDCGDCVIIPGLTDLHTHAPQFANRGMAMDLQLLDWLNTYTFPEETKFADLEYARRAYGMFVHELKQGATTRACIFATVHVPATVWLMDELERSGLCTYVGKVNMDRNSPKELVERTADSIADTTAWLRQIDGRYSRTSPMLTPRFIPSCTDELLRELGHMAQQYQLPVQSHLSENPAEVAWVKELCPWAKTYGHAYDKWGLFGSTPTIMAHCVWCPDAEMELMKKNGVTIAHSPSSNRNLSSGIAPAKDCLDAGLKIGLATDLSAGESSSILKVMSDAIAVSKLRWRYIEEQTPPLTMEEAFYMGTIGGGSFFGKVGSLEAGYEFDAVVIDDHELIHPQELTLHQRLERIIHLSAHCHVVKKYVRGREIFL